MRPGQELEHTIGEYNFKIKKFAPEIATYWAFRAFGNFAFQNFMGLEGQLQAFIHSIDRLQFAGLRKDCLSHVFVKMDSGTPRVIDEAGNLVIPEIGWDAVFELILISLTFTLKDFFAPARFEGVIEYLWGMFQKTGPSDSSASLSS